MKQVYPYFNLVSFKLFKNKLVNNYVVNLKTDIIKMDCKNIWLNYILAFFSEF